MQLLKHCQIGEKVKANGKEAILIEQLGTKFRVIYPDGKEEQVDNIEPMLVDTRLKGKATCPLCSHKTMKVLMERNYGGNNVYQCMKCGMRFSPDSI